MNTPEPKSNDEKLALSNILAGRIRSANYYLTDFIEEALIQSPRLSALLGIRKEDMDVLRADTELLRLVMGTPFVAVVPLLRDVNDWRSLLTKTTTTVALDKLRRLCPPLDKFEQRLVYYNNRSYVWLLVEILHASALAAPILGISQELADYLREIPQHELDMAITSLEFPIFRWRITSPSFHLEYKAHRLGIEAIAHYFMHEAPIRLGAIEPKREATHLPRYDRERANAYSAMLARIGCRAATIASLLNITTTRARQAYQTVNGTSSPPGQSPSSSQWHFESALVRVQSTTFLWLYRIALADGANSPEALIAAYSVLDGIFVSELKLTADRASHLARSIFADAELAMAPCRACGTQYLISNGPAKVELTNSFACPCCSGSLNHHKAVRRRPTR